MVVGLAQRSGASDALLSFVAEDCVFANSLAKPGYLELCTGALTMPNGG
jgi:hypothetical protein